MTIYNVSGNFQPPSEVNGRALPPLSDRAPSTNVDHGVKLAANDETSIVSVNSDAAVKRDEPKEKQLEPQSQIEEFQNFNQSIERSLQFKVDEELGVTIVRVVDKETDELIRQFPPEELINLSRRLKELNEDNLDAISPANQSGILLQEKV